MRMNNRLRNILLKYTDNLLQKDPAYQQLKDQQIVKEKNLHKAAKIVFENYCTKEEQKILAKFNIGVVVNSDPNANKNLALAKRDDNIYQNAYGCMTYTINTQDLALASTRLPAYCLPLRSNHPFWVDYEEYNATKDKASIYLREKRQPYYLLIEKAPTLEKIFEVWPEAKECPDIQKPISNLPSPITKTVIQEIQTDMARRQILAEQTQ